MAVSGRIGTGICNADSAALKLVSSMQIRGLKGSRGRGMATADEVRQRRERARAEIVARTGIDDSMIRTLVHRFYARVRKRTSCCRPCSPRGSPDWDAHLARMCAFWSSVALMSGIYHGQPMEKHLPPTGRRRAISTGGWPLFGGNGVRSPVRRRRPRMSSSGRAGSPESLEIGIAAKTWPVIAGQGRTPSPARPPRQPPRTDRRPRALRPGRAPVLPLA